MKVLIAGDWHSELHEEAVFQALFQLGHDTSRFSWHDYFKTKGRMEKLKQPLLKIQNKYMIGPQVNQLNLDILAKVAYEKPDFVFIYRGTHIFPETLREMRFLSPGIFIAGYNNDDPFSPFYPKWKWRHFLACIPVYDLIFAYRKHNIRELEAAGAKQVKLLRSWFIPERNHPVVLTEAEKARFACDVVFVGHYEDDGRIDYLEEIVRCGWNLRIFGPGYEWNDVLQRSEVLKEKVPVDLVWGRDYNLSLSGAKMSLCFFSKLNRDTYTRRCFEIPASGSVLVSEYSSDLAELFENDKEAVFFVNKQEMKNKIKLLLSDESLLRQIASEGTKRVWRDKHDVVSRMKYVLSTVERMVGK